MKQRYFPKAILTLLVVVLLMGTLCTLTLAADTFKNCDRAYGEIVPTDEKLDAQRENYKFYGDSGKLYFMRISRGKTNAWFAVEIYSDSQYKNQIRSFQDKYSETPGNKPLSITWNFKAIKSGTYYGKCYTFYTSGDKKVIDSSSLKTFTININRVGKRVVPLTALKNTSAGPEISWTLVPTATQYRVFRRGAGEKDWTFLKAVGGNATSFVDKTAKSGKYYAYTVKCKDGKNESLYDTKGLYIMYLAQPKGLAVNGAHSAGAAHVTWKPVTGAEGYYIYRKGGSLSDYDWKIIATIKDGKASAYNDYKAKSTDWNYTYTVRAFNGKYFSDHDKTGVDFNYIPAPKITKVSSYDKGMQITWTASNPNITEYYVFRKSGDTWKRIGTTTKKSFIDTSVTSGNAYTYTVKAACKTNAGAYNANGVTAKYMASPKLQPLKFDSNYNAIIKWSPVKGAAGYKVYRKINDGKSWYLLATVKGGKVSSYTDKTKKYSGYKYTYTIRAYDSKEIHSWFTSGTSAVCLAKPVFKVIQKDTADKSLAMELTWGKINGATQYRILRRVPGGSWKALGTTKALKFIDKTAKSGTKYQYIVKALNNSGSESHYYVKDAIGVKAPVINNVVIADKGIKISWNATEKATYKIYRSKYNSTKWTLIGTSKAASFIDKDSDAKLTQYYYAVTTVLNKTESIKSAKKSNATDITATAVYDAKTKTIKLKWNSPLAETVTITKTANKEAPVDLGAYTASLYTSFTDKSIEQGKKYTYKITAHSKNKVNGVVTVSATYPFPPLEKATVKKITADYNKGDVTCTLKWSAVKHATKYAILRSENKKDYKSVGTIAASKAKDGVLTYTDHISAEKAYTYKIKAVSSQGREASYSAATTAIRVYKPLDSVKDLKTKAEKNADKKISVTLSWAATQYAEGYTVYRKTEGGKYVELTTMEKQSGKALPTKYVDTTAKANVKYTYKVTAFSATRGKVSNTINYCWTEK